MAVTRIELADLDESLTDLACRSVGGSVLCWSDEYFASASNLITPGAPIRRQGYYVETGAWFDGWETRRHNTAPSDWVVLSLGLTGTIAVVEVDTAYFNGNEAPAISLEGITLPPGEQFDSARAPKYDWAPIVARVDCGPSQRHFFRLDTPSSAVYTHVRLQQYPDGGIARLRLFGRVVPVFPADASVELDAASVGFGGRAIACSDQHFGVKENLLLPGRGADMGDGWETARSRTAGHKDWVVVQLGTSIHVTRVQVDTAHFRGNFPESVEVLGLLSSGSEAEAQFASGGEETQWQSIVQRSKTLADTIHEYAAEQIVTKGPFSHVKLVIHPDGGVKRLRVFGTRA